MAGTRHPTGGRNEYQRPVVGAGAEAHRPRMSKRNLAAVLWFLAGWVGAGGVFAMSGMPSNLGIAVGVVVAGLVWWDPAGWIWTRPTAKRRVRPINDVAAELERNAAAPSADAERIAR